MKILHYNILEGAQDSSGRRSNLLTWLRKQDADMVSLNELNGWESEMSSLAQMAGYDYATLHKAQKSSYHVGVMTRNPHKVLCLEHTPFHFGLLGIEYEGITFLMTHLMPQSSQYRLREAERLGQILSDTSGPVLLLGDLNTLSPMDRKEIEQPHVIQILRSNPKLAHKFLGDEGFPDYAPMEILTASGFIDLAGGRKDCYTVPTSSNKDCAHALPLRLDYMLANESFVETWNYNLKVVRTEETDLLSDHYPVICELTASKDKQ